MSASDLYAQDLRAVPMLAPEEQHALACRFAKHRDPRDARRLVLGNLRLVLSIAKSLGGVHRSDWMDLVQEGNAGLMVAIDRFDPTRGLRLSAYASIWIRAFMLRHLMETGHVVRSTTTREGRRRFFDRSLPADVSLDAPAGRDHGDGGSHASVLDFVPGDDSLRPDVAAEARSDLDRVRSAVARLEQTLSARDREILRSRLLCERPKPLRQVGSKLSLSGERVRQLEHDMLGRLRTLVAKAPT
jgi:RNA polymerase sigma-32 factor